MTASLRKQLIAGLLSLAAGVSIMSLVLVRPQPAQGFPAFARKYGLPCSACHEAWPKLNSFGIVFKDNGYQLGNERDSPIYQNPSYWPVTFRMTPFWSRESSDHVGVDAAGGGTAETTLTTNGFNLSGLDILSGGTLYKNISFLLVPSADETGAFHFESVWVRFDNLFKSRWVNVKFGKSELDMPETLSEKRGLMLSANGSSYQSYHFNPVGDINEFGLGDNQMGIEVVGHSRNSYTRYALDFFNSASGNVDQFDNNGNPAGNTYDFYAHFSQAFQIPKLGLQRIGALFVDGRRATSFLTSGGEPLGGSGMGSAPFTRVGAYGAFYFGPLNYNFLWYHGQDNVYLATGTPKILGPAALPAGAVDPTWNGYINEAVYTINPQFVIVGRYELLRMNQQTYPLGTVIPNVGLTQTANLGNTDNFVVGYRWYPIMFSRAGLAIANEFSRLKIEGISPVTGSAATSNSVFVGLDFDF